MVYKCYEKGVYFNLLSGSNILYFLPRLISREMEATEGKVLNVQYTGSKEKPS